MPAAEADLWAAKDQGDFAQRVAKLPLKFQPGAHYHYSIAVEPTGLVSNASAAMSFGRYLQDKIFTLGHERYFFCSPKKQTRPLFYPITFLIPARPSRLT